MQYKEETLEILAQRNIDSVRNSDISFSWVKASHFILTLTVVALFTVAVMIGFVFKQHSFDVKSVQKKAYMDLH